MHEAINFYIFLNFILGNATELGPAVLVILAVPVVFGFVSEEKLWYWVGIPIAVPF
jgi:hypothetical protein